MRGKSSSVVNEAERVAREYQGRIAQGEGVTVPTWLFFLLLGTGVGVILGPSLMSTTAVGSAKLAELSRRYIERR